MSHKPLSILVKKRIASEFEWGFAMIEHSPYFKSSAIEETLLNQFGLTFQHLRKLFVGHSWFP